MYLIFEVDNPSDINKKAPFGVLWHLEPDRGQQDDWASENMNTHTINVKRRMTWQGQEDGTIDNTLATQTQDTRSDSPGEYACNPKSLAVKRQRLLGLGGLPA